MGTFKSSNPKIWISIGATMLAAFIAFTAHEFYVTRPKEFATKAEVRELKTDICEKLGDMKLMMGATNKKLDWLIEKQIK